MSVEIRLARHGRGGQPFYRIVVADKAMPRDGRYLELIGRYNTLVDPAMISLKEDRVRHWITQGAEVTDTVRRIIAKVIPGYYEEIVAKRRAKLQAARKARKTRTGGSAKKSAKPAKVRSTAKGKKATKAAAKA